MEPLRVDVETTPIDDPTTEDKETDTDKQKEVRDAGGDIELEASKRIAYAIISCCRAGDYM